MLGGIEIAQPGPVEVREFGRQRRDCIDEPCLLDDGARQIFVAGEVAQLMLWIEQRESHHLERVRVAQAGDDAIEQLPQRMRPQQLDFPGLRLPQQQFVAGNFLGQRAQPLAQVLGGP
jgi:hypothetical protein